MQCGLCGFSNIAVKFTGRQIDASSDLLRCRGCGLSFMSGDEKSLSEQDKYWDNKKQETIYLDGEVEAGLQKDFSKKISLINLLTKKGRLLDVGCGIGQFLRVAKAEGWDVFGLDISERACRIAKERYGITVFVDEPERFESYGVTFDCITMWDVIEHLKDPFESLKSLRSKMMEDGLLVIRTPNENALTRRLIRALSTLGIRAFLKYVYYTPHYFYFNPKTLKRLLSEAGFRIVGMRLENTDLSFAKNKIDAHYKTKDKVIAKIILPIILFFSTLLRMQNKMVVFAKKVAWTKA